MRKIIPLWPLVVLVLLWRTDACPHNCRCNTEQKSVLCLNVNVTDIALGFPTDTISLDFDSGTIDVIGPGMIDNLANLTRIQIRGVKIGRIDNNIFHNSSKMELVILGENNLQHSTYLHNFICSIKSNASSRYGITLIFRDILNPNADFQEDTLKCLQKLNINTLSLQYSDQVALPPNTFSGLSIQILALKYIYYFGRKLNPSMFNGSNNILQLDLSHNDIALISFNDSASLFLPNLNFLTLEQYYSGRRLSLENSFSFEQLPKLRNLRIVNSFVTFSTDCYLSESLLFIDLLSVTFYLHCQKSITCTIRFACMQQLYHMNLTRYGQRPFVSLPDPDHISTEVLFRYSFQNCTSLVVLDIQENYLDTLWNGMFHGLSRLQNLSLQNNQISSWNSSVFEDLVSLKYLWLRQNRIKTIHKSYFPNPGYLLNLFDISKNIFSCTCEMYWFTRVLTNLTEKGILTNVNSTRCTDPDRYTGRRLILYKPTYGDCFKTWNSLPVVFNLFCLLSSVMIVCALCYALGYKYRWHFKFFTFQIKSRLRERRLVEDEMTHYKYDAFVSYCGHDVGWLKQELLPVIEDEMHYKLCLHDRDWKAGIDIVDNIYDSLVKSRKVILIISNAYAHSQWCQMELTMAQHHFIEKDKNCPILILLEDIHDINMTPRLALQMKSQTYIEWTYHEAGQKLFLKQVQRAIGKKQSSIRMQPM